MIVDVDTHWEATGYAPGEHPLEPWLDQLPTSIEMLAFGIAGDLLRRASRIRAAVVRGAAGEPRRAWRGSEAVR